MNGRAGAQELQDRLYLNDGEGSFNLAKNALPQMPISGSVVRPYDFDADGDVDLFVGGRQVPGKYPYPTDSYLLENQSADGQVKFIDVTDDKAPDLRSLGMITDAKWVDLTGDGLLDLVVVGEWTPIHIYKNTGGKFESLSSSTNLSEHTGWWFSVAAADIDHDGDMDLVAGNLGKNYKYKASYDEPFEVYSTDFDKNGSIDIVLSYYDLGKSYPLRGRSCSSGQMPFIKKKFPTYNDFGSATLVEVYGEELESSLHYSATTFSTSYIENLGNGKFKLKPFSNEAQFSSVNDILFDDYNNDGNLDVLMAGNLYSSEIETPRNDGGYGLVMLGDGNGNFKPVPASKSGLFLRGDVKHIQKINIAGNDKASLLVAKNNDALQLVKVK